MCGWTKGLGRRVIFPCSALLLICVCSPVRESAALNDNVKISSWCLLFQS